jgi:hypothetical protein
MTTRLTLTVDVPDEQADRAEHLLRAIANGPALHQRVAIERRPLNRDDLADEMRRIMKTTRLFPPSKDRS